jgi:hypothetical protein
VAFALMAFGHELGPRLASPVVRITR